MPQSSNTDLIQTLRQLIIDNADKPFDFDSLSNDEPLFGPESRLALDSLDALQLSMAIKKRFGIRIGDSKETRQIFESIHTLADYVSQHSEPNNHS